MSDIFISYARPNEPQARLAGEALRTLGYNVWRDDELPAHRAYSEVIEERIKAAKAVLVLWSADAARSQWVRAEADAAREAGIFHHLITLPTYHTAALSTDNLARRYFGEEGMLGYVKQVQREEIRQGIACVKHQNMAGSDIGDDHKEYFAGEAALKAGGEHNTMNQFAAA